MSVGVSRIFESVCLFVRNINSKPNDPKVFKVFFFCCGNWQWEIRPAGIALPQKRHCFCFQFFLFSFPLSILVWYERLAFCQLLIAC